MVEDSLSIAGTVACLRYSGALANLTGQANRLANYTTTIRLSKSVSHHSIIHKVMKKFGARRGIGKG